MTHGSCVAVTGSHFVARAFFFTSSDEIAGPFHEAIIAHERKKNEINK